MGDRETEPELRSRSVGPWQSNSYALICTTTRQSVLIDPAAEPKALLATLADSAPVAILLTHAHIDHIGALDEMVASLKVPVMAHVTTSLRVDRRVNDGDLVPVGRHALQVYHAPGHTDDMICFSIVDHPRVIVGDAIFDGGPGHTSSPQAFRTTLSTLRNVILGWPDETVCYPGHGAFFRLGDRRAAIEAFVSKDHGDFCGHASWDM
jgi:hydroxyacylglutathione hydrolase